MAGLTLEYAETKLAEYLAAETKILKGQKISMDGKELTRANLADIQSGIKYWDERCKSLDASSSGRSRAVTVRGW